MQGVRSPSPLEGFFFQVLRYLILGYIPLGLILYVGLDRTRWDVYVFDPKGMYDIIPEACRETWLQNLVICPLNYQGDTIHSLSSLFPSPSP